MTAQYRFVIEVDTKISSISVSYIYLSMKSLDVKCFMHTGTRSAKAIIVDWSALDRDQVRMGARLMCCSISLQAECFCQDNFRGFGLSTWLGIPITLGFSKEVSDCLSTCKYAIIITVYNSIEPTLLTVLTGVHVHLMLP